MIRVLEWPRVGGHAPSAFAPGVERPLSITLVETPDASPDQHEAFEIIRWLSRRPHLSVYDATIDRGKGRDGATPLTVQVNDGREWCLYKLGEDDWPADDWGGVISPNDLTKRAEKLQVPVDYLGALQVHRVHHRDIFVTSSAALLGGQFDANIMDPLEASRIVGLFLRGRHDYHVTNTLGLDRIGFYHYATKYRTPDLGPYFGVCYRAGTLRKDTTGRLAQAVSSRCVRALQSRDAIGLQFYQPQGNTTRDEMLYHFDYLTVLLVAAFDAQARIARRTYGVALKKERNLNFWDKGSDFMKGLRASGAASLLNIVEGAAFTAYHTLLRAVRNTVHSEGLLPIGGYTSPHPGSTTLPPGSLLALSADEYAKVVHAANDLGGCDVWGVDARGVEPYTFAIRLVDQGLAFVNTIAAATEVAKLYPAGSKIPPPGSVWTDPIETPAFMRRISILSDGRVP